MLEQRLTFVRLTGEKAPDNHVLAEYQCACGKTTVAMRSRVKNGYTRSCGCLIADTKPGLTHGGRNTPAYSSWQSMRQRCNNPANKDFARWGAKGIRICERWDNFENFLSDMGERPEGTSLDRIDNEGDYEPGNCRWATSKEQQRNRRSAMRWRVKGIDFETAQEAALHFGVTEQSVHRWVFGSHDARRGTFTPSLEDCHAQPRY